MQGGSTIEEEEMKVISHLRELEADKPIEETQEVRNETGTQTNYLAEYESKTDVETTQNVTYKRLNKTKARKKRRDNEQYKLTQQTQVTIGVNKTKPNKNYLPKPKINVKNTNLLEFLSRTIEYLENTDRVNKKQFNVKSMVGNFIVGLVKKHETHNKMQNDFNVSEWKENFQSAVMKKIWTRKSTNHTRFRYLKAPPRRGKLTQQQQPRRRRSRWKKMTPADRPPGRRRFNFRKLLYC